MKALKEMIKNKSMAKVMLFYGPENFMMNFYLKKSVETIIAGGDLTMNYDLFSEKKTTLDTINDGIETLPFFADQRVVVLSNLDLIGKNKISNDLAVLIEKLPETTYLIIVESEVDKRKKMFKTIKKMGHIIEFPYLSEGELVKYIARGLGKFQIKISGNDARYMIQHVGGDLTVLHNEIEKLASFLGDVDIATKEAIDEIC